MSTSAVSSSALSNLLEELLRYNSQKRQTTLEKLGTDLKSGNLAAAQADFATLTGDTSGTASTTATSKDPVVQDLVTLSKDLKSGDTTAAQKDFSALTTDLVKEASTAVSNTSSVSSTNTSEAQELLKLLQSLSSSSSSAVAAYAANS